MKKILILEREVNGRIHRTKLADECPLHCDIISRLAKKCFQQNILIDVDELFNQIVSKKTVISGLN